MKALTLTVACGLSAALGAGVVVLLVEDTQVTEDTHTGRTANTATPTPLPAVDLSFVYQRLDALESERDALASRVDTLSEQLAALPVASPAPDSLDDTRTQNTEDEDDGELDDFMNAGFSEDRATYLVEHIAQRAMERLYLRDKALRENWMGTDRFRDAMQAIEDGEQALRTELGDEDYDRYLYASGNADRVRIDTIIPGSPAQEAGLRAGDTLRGYDESAIFTIGEVRSSTSSGVAGELVRVSYLRNGVSGYAYIPRGPLGVHLRGFRQQP